MPLPTDTCRSCGRTIRAGTTYCVPCATRDADGDATVFDRWLTISLRGSLVIAILLAIYLAAGYWNRQA